MIVVGHHLVSHAPLVTGDEDHALVLGPPRSGKSSGFIVPSVLTHEGPVVVASSKSDVARSTGPHRLAEGPAWLFSLDPAMSPGLPSEIRRVGWSPVVGCEDWDEALLRGRAMVGGSTAPGAGDGGERFWRGQAERLLAALLHAAALHGWSVEDVARWVLTGDLREPEELLARAGAAWAAGIVRGLDGADSRLRDSVVITASDPLRVYDSEAAKDLAAGPLFPVEEFLDRSGTLYVVAAAEHQEFFAPLVVGLLDQIRRARFRRSGPTVLFALDELAHIAPLPELPRMLAEGGSQGVQVLAALQDLSQARGRWGTAADGFLTLFSHKVLLPGLLDRPLLEGLSALLGEQVLPVAGGPVTRPVWPVHDLAAGDPATAVHVDGAVAHRVAVIRLHDLGGESW